MTADSNAGDLRPLKMAFRVLVCDHYLWLSHLVHRRPAFVFRCTLALGVPCDTSAALAAVAMNV
jgi:hypothetical protein